MKERLSGVCNLLSQMHDQLCKGCFVLGASMLFFLTLSIGYEVVSRYFFSRPTAWALDFSEYILIYSTFMSAPWLLRTDGHVSVTILVEYLGENKRQKLDLATSVIGAVVCAIVAYQTSIDTWDAFERGVKIVRPILVPKFMILWVIPFGLILLFTSFLKRIFNLVRVLRTKP